MADDPKKRSMTSWRPLLVSIAHTLWAFSSISLRLVLDLVVFWYSNSSWSTMNGSQTVMETENRFTNESFMLRSSEDMQSCWANICATLRKLNTEALERWSMFSFWKLCSNSVWIIRGTNWNPVNTKQNEASTKQSEWCFHNCTFVSIHRPHNRIPCSNNIYVSWW